MAEKTTAAEARGFEPPVPCKGDNSLAVSPIRPLWHASSNHLSVPEHHRGFRPAGREAYTAADRRAEREAAAEIRADFRRVFTLAGGLAPFATLNLAR